MTQAEAADVKIDDVVQVRVQGRGWVQGTVVYIVYPPRHSGKRHGYLFGIWISDEIGEFPDVPARYVKRIPRKQDWSPRAS